MAEPWVQKQVQTGVEKEGVDVTGGARGTWACVSPSQPFLLLT